MHLVSKQVFTFMTNVFTAFSCQRTFVIFYLLNSDIAGGVAHNYAFLYSQTHRVSAKEVLLESRWCPRSCSEYGAAAVSGYLPFQTGWQSVLCQNPPSEPELPDGRWVRMICFLPGNWKYAFQKQCRKTFRMELRNERRSRRNGSLNLSGSSG